MRKPARLTEARLALGRRLAILRRDAGALNSIQFRSAAAAAQPTWACRSVVMALGITESQQPACTHAFRFHSDLPNTSRLAEAPVVISEAFRSSRSAC
jgi:hypothetical protein